MNADERLEIQGLVAEDDAGAVAVEGVNLVVRSGEIVGIAGVSGNGQSELMQVLAGQREPRQGEIRVHGEAYGRTRTEMAAHKVFCLPEEPLRNACVAPMSVAENLAFRVFDQPPFAAGGWWLNRAALQQSARRLISRYRIKTQSPEAPIATLSGGNVQRTVLARELSGEVEILVVANPCFGLDFLAVAEIRAQIVAARNRGVAVLLLSEDLDEILELADRVFVMFDGPPRLRHPHRRGRSVLDGCPDGWAFTSSTPQGGSPRQHQVELVAPLVEAGMSFIDLRQARETSFVPQMLDRMRRRGAGKPEMLVPAEIRARQDRVDIGAVEDVAGAVGIEDPLDGNVERRQYAIAAGSLIINHAARAHRHPADPAAARAQILQHLAWRHSHLLAEALGNHRDIDKAEQIMRVRAQPAAVERGQDPRLAARLGIVDRGVRLMPVDMQRAAPGEVQRWMGMLVAIVATADDRALAGFRHHERQRGSLDFAVMQRDAVFRRHVDKHPPEPIVGDRGQEVGGQSELGAAKGSRHGVAAEGHGIVARHGLLVAGGQEIGEEGDVDLGLADKERLHGDATVFEFGARPGVAGAVARGDARPVPSEIAPLSANLGAPFETARRASSG